MCDFVLFFRLNSSQLFRFFVCLQLFAAMGFVVIASTSGLDPAAVGLAYGALGARLIALALTSAFALFLSVCLTHALARRRRHSARVSTGRPRLRAGASASLLSGAMVQRDGMAWKPPCTCCVCWAL